MVVKLCFSPAKTASDPAIRQCCIIGKLESIKDLQYSDVKEKLSSRVSEEDYNEVIAEMSSCPSELHLWRKNAVICFLASTTSRHNCSAQPHLLTAIISNKVKIMDKTEACIVMVCEKKDAFASACAIARCFPLYSMKTCKNNSNVDMVITVEFCFVGEDKGKLLTDEDAACMTVVAEGIRHSAKIVDMPCNEMHTDAFIKEIEQIKSQLDGVKLTLIRGEELRERGFGGIYGVGKAAVHPPALAILSYTPENATKTIAWVGKGIVYDTGGLSIKTKTGMPGMKRDCGGAAGVLGAFYAAVKQGFKENLHALFCLAENAVGPIATRPDDIHTLYSGKTVEINNTDAEGRLVLSDGVAYAMKDLHADIILDMATLTGAQGVATGKYHAALLTNSGPWEQAGVLAGKSSGDLMFPVPYSPELHFSEFNSAVADMKNSVASRENAQVSCAGLFIGAHLGFDYKGVWMHVDMASPAEMRGERATGYGVALLVTLFGQASESTLLQELSPNVLGSSPV